MKIQASNIDLNSKSISLQLQRKLELVQIKKVETKKPKMVVDVDYIYEKNLSEKSKINTQSKVTKTENLPEIDETLSPREQVAKFLLEYIFGVKIQVNFYKIYEKEKQKQIQKIQPQKQNIEIERIEFNERFEAESLNFSAKGIIKTKDGRSIEFSLSLQLNREYYTISSKNETPKQDPLVFNFTNSDVEFSKVKYQFDINADGSLDSISFPNPGSGYLVLDFNENDIVDDGKELVGAISGDAISDLKKFDKDNNDWIDENDYIYENLKIWEKTISGRDLLSSLQDKDIGAIYLNLAKTPFQIKDTNENFGEITHSGIFVKENGLVRPFHRINLNL